MGKTKKEMAPPKRPSKSKLRKTPKRPDLSVDRILGWADAHRERTGRWPNVNSGRIVETIDDTWRGVNQNLRNGGRGLPRNTGDSLARLLMRRRGVRNVVHPPQLSERQIIAWVKEHRRRTGEWPLNRSGVVVAAPEETWIAVDLALRRGLRGLKGESSLARLLDEHFGVRNIRQLSRLSEKLILRWCDAHHRRTGAWPTRESGAVAEASEEKWSAIDMALRVGARGLSGGDSLARLLGRRRRIRNRTTLPSLSVATILQWCDAHHRRTGAWPTKTKTPIDEAPAETWLKVDAALSQGSRGLPTSYSLAKLLARERNVRNRSSLPALSLAKVIKWCKAHELRTGKWPAYTSGPVVDSPGETWAGIDNCLRIGTRGLPGGLSVAKLRKRRSPSRGQPSDNTAGPRASSI
jgi:hypothetical protein